MSEFQLSLLAIGLVVVAGVFLYGQWQQWRYRRSVGEPVKSKHAESTLQAPPHISTVHGSLDPDSEPLSGFEGNPDSRVEDEVCGLLNDATDYVVTFLLKGTHTPAVLEPLWSRRFDFGKSIHACGLNTGSGLWERLIPESGQTYRAFRIGLQLVDRSGAVNENRLTAFRDLLGDIAAKLHIEVKLPPVEEALQRAQELDRFCADVDQMIGINLLAGGDRKLFGTEVASAAAQQGMSLQTDGTFHLLDKHGTSLFSLSASDGTAFHPHTLNQSRVDSLTLLLDIPRVVEPVHCFDEMVALAQALAKALRLTLADDQRVALSDGAIAQIRAQIAANEDLMLVGHITPGSAQSLRLFS